MLTNVPRHTLPIAGNEEIFHNLSILIIHSTLFAHPDSVRNLGIMGGVDTFDHRETIFRKVVLPSSQFLEFLISNRHILNRRLLDSFTRILEAHLSISPFHRRTLEYVLASPIVMAFSSCLSFFEDDQALHLTLSNINQSSLYEWKKHGPEVVQSGKRMMQALFSESFEDTLEPMMMNDKSGDIGFKIVEECHLLSQELGSNVDFAEW
ncbi:hypothetical protein BLNAU_7198 [Blattamonas nauphoetae]|uniref:Uncharacterized protein n=1 Tax=Blattamonas nauphoetae TaxID=2049346 RepID=A0ABQ9Y201_9EUKA|nr:hypothetical protein BLNAU_7198 [Blattamonas nauphoetae]